MKKKGVVICSLAIFALLMFPGSEPGTFNFPARLWAKAGTQLKMSPESLAYLLAVHAQIQEADRYCQQEEYPEAMSYYDQAMESLKKAEACLTDENMPQPTKEKFRNELKMLWALVYKMKINVAEMMAIRQTMKELEAEKKNEISNK